MKDVEKIRREYDEKIRIAELENSYNVNLEKEGVTLTIFSRNKEGRHLGSVKKVGATLLNSFDGHDVQTVFRLLPITEDILVNVGGDQRIPLACQMQTHRAPRESCTTLSIHYISGELEVWIDLPVDERNHELMQYFTRTSRDLDGSTIGLYYGCVSTEERRHLQTLPFLTFNCGKVIRFQGGYHTQASAGHVSCILETLMNDDFSWEKRDGE